MSHVFTVDELKTTFEFQALKRVQEAVKSHFRAARVAEEEVAPAFAWCCMLPKITEKKKQKKRHEYPIRLGLQFAQHWLRLERLPNSRTCRFSVFLCVLGSHPSCWPKEMLHRVTSGGGPLQQISLTLLVHSIPICIQGGEGGVLNLNPET